MSLSQTKNAHKKKKIFSAPLRGTSSLMRFNGLGNFLFFFFVADKTVDRHRAENSSNSKMSSAGVRLSGVRSKRKISADSNFPRLYSGVCTLLVDPVD